MLNALTLTGQVALVTGAGHGIGQASALALAEAGALVVASDIDFGRAAETEQLIKDAGYEGVAAVADVTEEKAMAALVDDICRTYGRLDVVHANAGVLMAGTALTQTLEEWDTTFRVNVRGTFLTVRAVLPQMIKQESGAIVLTASVSGLIGEPDLVAYNTSKGALVNLTRQLAIEYAEHGIRVNGVCPGWIETGFNDPVLGHLDRQELDQLVGTQVPLGRQGTPGDIAPAVVFLASDWARYITGQLLPIDGGLTSM
ncbi:SDR family NAD(P)-dependent oxidoreductase [Arthrobacter bambusae]|uniref:SDR family NAD(P)-dependent oxidoreductase n=1 Tax=Arthrobacter bambusae TaxID=1338426 RepID=UPI0027890D35|nr:SDR family NAD(P)-dependent oxidoreductase [Arthrobacter bambusae]MDQ0212440.1 NAD(P)-dependent dehydrogenase (short-subunit alcohol dehydrogenase family) [Arthrobacter bambusae]MDQ0236888.1 NAD(P)-dependent dehydrogenase (short-subunit alcohol dehydrogenase family) [Arthrobacter bambusae]